MNDLNLKISEENKLNSSLETSEFNSVENLVIENKKVVDILIEAWKNEKEWILALYELYWDNWFDKLENDNYLNTSVLISIKYNKINFTNLKLLKKYNILPNFEDLFRNELEVWTKFKFYNDIDFLTNDFFELIDFNNLDEFLEIIDLFFKSPNWGDEPWKHNYKMILTNLKYLNKQFWRKVELFDFTWAYINIFIKFWDSDNLDFLLKEINKTLNCTIGDLLRMMNYKDIEYRHMLSFITQHWLSEKVKIYYEIKWEDFDIENYFKNEHNYNWADDEFWRVSDNMRDKSSSKEAERCLLSFKNKEQNILNFSNNLDFFIKKYPNIEINKDLYELSDKIWDNIFLFDEFDISQDYFKNMRKDWPDEDKEFLDFLIYSDIDILNFIIHSVKGIKIKDLFAMYKVNYNLLTSRNIINWNNHKLFQKNLLVVSELFNYSINKWNYYFLMENISFATYFYWEDIENMWEYIIRIRKVLNKTWWFLTNSLINNYVLEKSPREGLDEIWEKYQTSMKKVLSSEEIKKEDLNDYLYEIILMAYRPTWYSEETIKEMIENWEIEDLTYQLKNIVFNKSGYDLVFNSNKLNFNWNLKDNISKDILKFLWKDAVDSNFDFMGHDSFPNLKEKKSWIFNDLNIKQFFSKATELEKIEHYFQRFYWLNFDDRLEKFRYLDSLSNLDSEWYYKFLNEAYEIFWVITKDSFSGPIFDEIDKENKNKVDEIFNKIIRLKDKNIQDELKRALKINLFNSIEEVDEIFKSSFIEIQTQERIIDFWTYMRKKIKKELKKFKLVRWEEKQFKAYISNNIWSFFAKAWAELCTSWNIKMWFESRHVHLNLVDKEKQQIVWNIMLYFEKDRDYLIARWFNPIKELVNSYDNKGLVEEMIRTIKTIAKQNGFDKVYIPEIQWWWHNLSNRDNIQKLVWNYSLKNKEKDYYCIENAKFYQTEVEDNNIVDKLYLL